MSMLSDALAMHATSLLDSAGEKVSYVRGDTTISNVGAVAGQSVFEEVASDGEVRSLTKTVDWIIKPSALVIASAMIEPQRGDRIVKANGESFDVLPGSANTAWQWSDAHRTHYRIHTVRRVAS